MDPAISVEGLLCHLRLAVVALEGDGTAVADFAARDRVASVVCVCTEIVHVGDVKELDLNGGERSTNMTDIRVVVPSDAHTSCALSLPVAFLDLAAEGDLEEVENVSRNRRGSGNHGPHSPAKDFSELTEHDGVVEGILCLGR